MTYVKKALSAAFAVVLGMGVAHAGEENFPVVDNGPNGDIKVKWNVTPTGGLVLAGQNASGTPVTVQHTKDGNQKGVERHPIFKVIGKHNKNAVERTLPTVQILDGTGGSGSAAALTIGRSKANWSYIVNKQNDIFLRKQEKFQNGYAFVRFYAVTDQTGVSAGQEVCPRGAIDAQASDVKDRGGTKFSYAKNNVIVLSCDQAFRLNDASIPYID